MPHDPLPEKPDQWPDNPFELLGVERSVDALTLRRAYNALIRRFKPEQYPEQFRRIREAYEACQNPWASGFPAEFFSSDVVKTIIVRPILSDDSQIDNQPNRSLATRPLEENNAWVIALNGDRPKAYAILKNQYESQHDGETARRLYWLLAIDPKLDTTKRRLDWLATNLVSDSPTWAVARLYEHELEVDPAMIDHLAFENLLANRHVDMELGLFLANVRIIAAGRMRRLTRLMVDIKTARERFCPLDDDQYLSLIVPAAEYASWSLTREFSRWLDEEMQSLQHLELRRSYEFERLEMIAEVGPAFEMLIDHPVLGSFTEWIRDVWIGRVNLPSDVCRSSIAEFVGRSFHIQYQIAYEYSQALSPKHWTIIGRILERERDVENKGVRDDFIRGIVRSVSQNGERYWNQIQSKLMRELILHDVAPNEFINAVSAHQKYDLRQFAINVDNDWAFQLVVALNLLHRV